MIDYEFDHNRRPVYEDGAYRLVRDWTAQAMETEASLLDELCAAFYRRVGAHDAENWEFVREMTAKGCKWYFRRRDDE